jgi:AraC family transcriptional regulator, ethanolamine operon transcriptional activator
MAVPLFIADEARVRGGERSFYPPAGSPIAQETGTIPMFIRQTFEDAIEQRGEIDGWRQDYRQLGAGRYRSAVSLMTLPGVAISRERINVAVMQETKSPADSTVVLFPIAAEGGWRINGHHEQDSVVALRQGSTELLTAVGAASDLIAVALNPDTLPPPSRRAGTFSVRRNARDAMLLDWIDSLLGLSASGFVFGDADSRLVAELIAERFMDFGPRLNGCLSIDQVGAACLDVFRKVKAFIDRLPDEPVTLGALARHLDIPMADIYGAIRACTGMSPADWLRNYRLDGARRNLLAAGRTRSRVSDIAMSWGFCHLGRFSCGYHRHFGEPPRATIVRGAQSH